MRVLNRIDDSGVALPGLNPASDLILGGSESVLALELVETKRAVALLGFALFPDLNALAGDDLFIGWGSRGSIGSGGRWSRRKASRRVGFLRNTEGRKKHEKWQRGKIDLHGPTISRLRDEIES